MKIDAYKIVLLVMGVCTWSVSQDVIDGIAAIVGDNVILKSEVAQLVQMSALELQYDPQHDAEKIERLSREVLQNLINQKVVLEIAEVESIVVEEREVSAALDQHVNSLVTRAGSEDRLEKFFGKSLKEIRRELWPDIQEQLTAERFRDQLLHDVDITRDEVYEFYEQYKDSLGLMPTLYDLSYIRFQITPGQASKNEALKKIASIRERALAGESFEDLARQFSEDPGSGHRGGNLGFSKRGTFVPRFEEVAYSLKPGEISPVIETQFGYHIIQTIEKMGDKINVRHILVKPAVSPADDDSVYALAKAVRDSIQNESQMASLASKYSDDPTTKERNGRIGWIEPSTFPIPEIAEILPSLEPAKPSLPIWTSDSYYILFIHRVRPGGVPTPQTHWPEIQSIALNKKKADFIAKWIQDASSKTYVKNYIE